jgi:outer membrane receptor protein involved in Fe transport
MPIIDVACDITAPLFLRLSIIRGELLSMASPIRTLFASFVATVATVLATPNPAFAQDQGADSGLEEVTVTATRRTDTNLQETPISVSAITAGDLERTAAKDISSMAQQVPGFSAARRRYHRHHRLPGLAGWCASR